MMEGGFRNGVKSNAKLVSLFPWFSGQCTKKQMKTSEICSQKSPSSQNKFSKNCFWYKICHEFQFGKLFLILNNKKRL